MSEDDDEAAWVDAGLLDPASPSADDRRELLAYLRDSGASLDDLRAAAHRGTLPRLAAQLLRASRRRLTAADVAAAAGVDIETVHLVSRAAGLPIPAPDERAYREEDAAAFRVFAGAQELLGEQATIEFTRSMGAALAMIADSAMAVFGIGVVGRFDDRGTSELGQARAITYAARALMEALPVAIDTLFFHHVDAAIGRGMESHTSDAHTIEGAVGFVDLVRSTTLVQELSPSELAIALNAFEQLAVETVGARRGRVVKTIGDEVMFVVRDATAACDTALALRDAVSADSRLPSVRGGIASGELVLGYGDFYGVEVTRAARAVKAASPGGVLVTGAIKDAVGDGFMFESVGTPELRGFDEPVELFTVERV